MAVLLLLFNYSPSGHIITGDFNIIENELHKAVSHGPKFREPQCLNCTSSNMHMENLCYFSIEKNHSQFLIRSVKCVTQKSRFVASFSSFEIGLLYKLFLHHNFLFIYHFHFSFFQLQSKLMYYDK